MVLIVFHYATVISQVKRVSHTLLDDKGPVWAWALLSFSTFTFFPQYVYVYVFVSLGVIHLMQMSLMSSTYRFTTLQEYAAEG